MNHTDHKENGIVVLNDNGMNRIKACDAFNRSINNAEVVFDKDSTPALYIHTTLGDIVASPEISILNGNDYVGISITFEHPSGDIIDLVLAKKMPNENGIKIAAFGDPYTEDPTYTVLLKKTDIDKALGE